MFKLLFLNLWSNIKRSPIISLIIFLQIVLTGFFLFFAIYQQTDLDIENSYIQNAYGKYKLFYVRGADISMEESDRSEGMTFTSIEETDYSDYQYFYDKINESKITKTAIQFITQLCTDYPISEWGIEDDSVGTYSFYGKKSEGENVTFDGIEYPSYRLNTWTIDQNYLDIFGLVLESGELFSEKDFSSFDPQRIPVILGYGYKDHFSIGDTFKASLFTTPGQRPTGGYSEYMTFEVIGFIKEGQWVYDIGGDTPIPLDTYMILPYFYKPLDEWIQFQEENPQYGGQNRVVNYYMYEYGIGVYTTKHYITSPENEAASLKEINSLLKEAGLEGYKAEKVISPEQLADQYEERTKIQGYLLIVMLILSLMSIIFVSINNISSNIKTYAIHNLVGATKGTIITYSVLETFIYCVLGFFGGYLWFETVLISNPYAHTTPAYQESFNISVQITFAYIILACAFSLIFVSIKMRSYSIAALIRGNEVRNGKSLSLYKVITFVMLVFVSICITFVTSYNYQVEHIDKYQRHFYSKEAYAFNIQPLPQENAPMLNVKYDIEADNYVVDYLIREIYDSIMGPSMRATYFKGNVDLPEMVWGRYFTAEEVKEESNYVVIGKNVIEDFIEEKDGKMFYKYLDKEYEVIGIMGREAHDTTIDNWVIFTLPTITSEYGYRGSYIVDAPTVEEITMAMDIFEEQLTPISIYSEKPFSASIDIGIPNYILNVFISLISLTAIVFGIYYTDKIKLIINIKKFLGYSKSIIFTDTAAQFIVISTAAFASGNALMWILSKTILKDFILFSAFRINLPVLTFSFGMIILISFMFSVIAINKAFRGSARDLKKD